MSGNERDDQWCGGGGWGCREIQRIETDVRERQRLICTKKEEEGERRFWPCAFLEE